MTKKVTGVEIEKPKRKRLMTNRIVSKSAFRRLVKLVGLKRISKDLMTRMPEVVEAILLKAVKDYIDSNTL
jgi:histone H3/H4